MILTTAQVNLSNAMTHSTAGAHVCSHCSQCHSQAHSVKGAQVATQARVCGAQAAVELILGFEKSWVTEENLAINQERFLAWTDAFNQTPLDLPGFSASPASCLYCGLASSYPAC